MTALADALADLDEAAAVDLVADLWRRAGWTVETDAPAPASVVATRSSRSDRDRRLVRVLAPGDGRAAAPELRGVVAAADEDADRVTVVSTTGFTRDALSVADAYGVDAVGPDAVVRLAEALDATEDLAALAD
ncbi:restriction endonuclease [Halobacterium yunchengense]|uniref:restriction endonuclease n=1 Tax=Halobacterium yunchengense TaxID=3108497 RepID=UPI00300A4E5F